jgi:hypothetical protein
VAMRITFILLSWRCVLDAIAASGCYTPQRAKRLGEAKGKGN